MTREEKQAALRSLFWELPECKLESADIIGAALSS